MELFQLAQYPFANEAKTWVKNEAVNIGEILTDSLYERARIRALARVREAFEKGIVEEVPLVNDADYIMELFSYPVARMIIASVESRYLVRRYALAEAKKAFQLLKNEPLEFIEQVAHEFDIHLSNQCIHFTEYLTYAPTWHRTWKLVNRDIRHGKVMLDKHDSARLIQEAITEKIQGELLHLFAPPEVKRLFKDDIMTLKSKLTKIERRPAIQEINETYYPPCIKQLISAAKSGTNIPHVGRFTLVTFLNEIGMDTDEILGVFAGSPDFNKEKSRYQVEHISGKASNTTYTTPKCDTILTWGLCFPDDICRTVRHPVSYYRRRSRR